MFYVKFVNDLPTEISTEHPVGDGDTFSRDGKNGWQNRNDWKTFDEVSRIARYLTAMTGETYLPSDAGPHRSPQYDIIKAPKIGDEVSYSFNGDSYPDGTIVKISPNWMVTTSTGKRYNRSRQGVGGGWQSVGGGSWSLIPGHHYEQNPSF